MHKAFTYVSARSSRRKQMTDLNLYYFAPYRELVRGLTPMEQNGFMYSYTRKDDDDHELMFEIVKSALAYEGLDPQLVEDLGKRVEKSLGRAVWHLADESLPHGHSTWIRYGIVVWANALPEGMKPAEDWSLIPEEKLPQTTQEILKGIVGTKKNSI
jgi:hypothetical protein